MEEFWKTGNLNPESNVQFGEGGAGTFSDGKLNTLVHDPDGRGREVLRLFASHGAPEEILYDSKPHIGTDKLIQVVRALRESILQMGGEFRFRTKLTKIQITKPEDGRRQVRSVGLEHIGKNRRDMESLDTDVLVLAIGHSARDTFTLLEQEELPMEPKAFAVGVRMEHPQEQIDRRQYGRERGKLPAASYKLTANLENGRGVYTFCMCPGGYVVNASSEPGRCAVNGMSYSGRDGQNANSAVIVTVSPEDYPGDGVLAGVEFQRRLEEAAYRAGAGSIPVQLFQDFCQDQPSQGPGEILPQIKGLTPGPMFVPFSLPFWQKRWKKAYWLLTGRSQDSQEGMPDVWSGEPHFLTGTYSAGFGISGICCGRSLSLRGRRRLRGRDHIRGNGRTESGPRHQPNVPSVRQRQAGLRNF